MARHSNGRLATFPSNPEDDASPRSSDGLTQTKILLAALCWLSASCRMITSIPARAIGARRAREIFNAREATTFYSSERNQLLAGGAFQAGALDGDLLAHDGDDASHTQIAQSGGGGLAIES